MDIKHKYTNKLFGESSPYLLQHAHNPVNWYPWGKEALEKAKNENKPILVSIGYSACHWCHVMERECFEDEEVAAMMNKHFICVKVDREERPDIDQIYMDAVQLMTLRGGWPLHCFVLPDGKPFYGGTYFPKETWMDILEKLSHEFVFFPGRVKEYAEKLTAGIRQSELIQTPREDTVVAINAIDEAVLLWKKNFDYREGGTNHAPKFPLPGNYKFLLQYGYLQKNNALLDYVNLSLRKMAFGGIYDHLGGGFSRYSVDAQWKVPHFEKMLYDNAQLVSLFSEAFLVFNDPLYKHVVHETLEFVMRELADQSGAFYSALDADSEGEEGKFYTWESEELKELLKDDFEITGDYYNVNSYGSWEEKYILLRKNTAEEIASKHQLSINDFNRKISSAKKILFETRSKRIRPATDDKSLTSWNALMLKGFADAYLVFNEEKYLRQAIENARFITHKQRNHQGGLFHSYKNGVSSINGFLEDYCFTIEAFITLYEATFDFQWLEDARELTDYCFLHFFDPASGMFYFTSDEDEPLITRKMELTDNVIPASNSCMAKNLFLLGKYYDDKKYLSTSRRMINNRLAFLKDHVSLCCNWSQLALWHTHPFYEIAVCGRSAQRLRNDLHKFYMPNKLISGSETKDNSVGIPLLENKFAEGKTMIYVCQNKNCLPPVTDAEEALKLLR